MRKSVVSLLLVFSFLLPVNANAVIDPFTWAMAGSLALHGSIAGFIARFRTQNGGVKPTSTGGAAMESTAVWVELVGLDAVVRTRPEVASISYSEFAAFVDHGSVSSPLYDAFFNTAGVEPPPATHGGTTIVSPTDPTRFVEIEAAPYSSGSCGTYQSPCESHWVMDTNAYGDYIWWSATGTVTAAFYRIVPSSPLDLESTQQLTPKTQTETIAALPAAVDGPGGADAAADAIVNTPGTDSFDCGNNLYVDGVFYSTVACTPSTTPPLAVTAAQQALAADAKNKLAAYNAAAAAYSATPNTTTQGALDATRNAYNAAAALLNNSLGQSGIPAAAQPIAPTTTTPVDPTGTTPPIDPGTTPYGTATNPVFGSYSSSKFSLSGRFGGFVDAMKGTSLFSIPGQFSSSIPTGGTSTMSFDGGRFGQHTFDFSTFSTVFAVVKSLFLIICSWVSLRIISKGGA